MKVIILFLFLLVLHCLEADSLCGEECKGRCVNGRCEEKRNLQASSIKDPNDIYGIYGGNGCIIPCMTGQCCINSQCSVCV